MSEAAQSFWYQVGVKAAASLAWGMAGGIAGGMAWGMTQRGAIAQAPTPPAPTPEFTTVCAYDPTAGVPNPLGMRTFITVREVAGNSVFRYQQFPAIVSGTGIPASPPASVEIERTLTLFETSIADARQLVVNNPSYYASLIGIPVADIGEADFAAVNATLACQDISGNIAGVPTPATPAPAPGTPSGTSPGTSPSAPAAPTLASLPNGNYRMTSAEFDNRIVSDEELLESGGYLFVFRKFNDTVTGSLSQIDQETAACVTGIVNGNTVTGNAYTDSEPTTINGKTYLDPLGILLLGDAGSDGEKYTSSVMNVAGLFRINAGTRIPPESCP